MSTWCGAYAPHDEHEWGIEANPGEDGPDLFWCDGQPRSVRREPLLGISVTPDMAVVRSLRKSLRR